MDRVSESVENLVAKMQDAEVGTDPHVRDLERLHKFYFHLKRSH